MTHDYKRHRHHHLFAVFSVLEGWVIGPAFSATATSNLSVSSSAKSRAGKLIHIVLDNYATHKHP